MLDVGKKPLPWRVSVRVPLPTGTMAGDTWVRFSTTGGLTVKASVSLVPPPGPGLVTATAAVPMVSSVAGTVAWSWVALSYTVARAVPFQVRLEVPAKFDPVTVSWKASLPAGIVVGLMAWRVGTGFWTSKSRLALLSPPNPLTAGLLTLTVSVAAVASSDAGGVATSWVLEVHVAGTAVPLTCTLVPDVMAAFPPVQVVPLSTHRKFVPVSVSIGVLPTSVADGLIPVRVTPGKVTPTSWALLVPPPGAGVTVCTDAT